MEVEHSVGNLLQEFIDDEQSVNHHMREVSNAAQVVFIQVNLSFLTERPAL
jgi:hypothetical protein